MTSPISSLTSPTNSTSTSGGASSSTGAQTLGQDAFLKLLIAQLKNQDPSNPASGTEFVTQLAQFSLVEQSKSQTTSLGTISTQLTGLSNSDATALVGKTVTVSGGGLTWNGSTAATSSVTLGAAAQQVDVSITDAQGDVVRTIKLGAEPTGPLAITWDGHTDSGQAAPAGNYTVNVSASNASGAPVPVAQSVTGVVSSVSFAQGYPQITLSNGTVAPISGLVSVNAAQPNP